MTRRTFLTGVLPVTFMPVRVVGQASQDLGREISSIGQLVNLARYGEAKSWLNPAAAEALSSHDWVDDRGGALDLKALGPEGKEIDVGVEWPEFRTIEKIIIRYRPGKTPRPGTQFVEYWSGLTARQGTWKALEDGTTNAAFIVREGETWAYSFARLRTCKVRVRFNDFSNIFIEHFVITGPSRWRLGQVLIDLGHTTTGKSFDGRLEAYNAEILDVQALAGASITGAHSWKTNSGKLSKLAVKVLYTWGMDVDRSILTLRTQSGDVSFLPAEAIETQPIEIPDFGIYVCNAAKPIEYAEFRKNNGNRRRIIDEVTLHPEQTLEQAYSAIQARRVTLSFVGVDANNHKFGIAPDGHIVVGSHDPSNGQAMMPTFAMYFTTTEEPRWFQPPSEPAPSATAEVAEAEWHPQQRLEEGWIPILTTTWSRNDVVFERTDFAHVLAVRDQNETAWNGNELAVLISRLRIANPSSVTKTATYSILPWKPATGNLGYGPIPPNIRNMWTTVVRENFVLVQEDDNSLAFCHVDTQKRGSLSAAPALNAARYTLALASGEQHTIYILLPGSPLPAADASKLTELPYDQFLSNTKDYWRGLRDKSMTVELPDERLQRIFDATQQHFLLAMTKDGKRREYYPNTAMLHYGSIGSESSPIIQALDMRGMHERARGCLRAWLSTQGDAMPAGNYESKEGGFFRFWPIYTVNQGAVLWALAEHYLYTRDQDWLREVAPQIVSGCEFLIRERNRTKTTDARGKKPLWWGLSPAGCVADPRDWEYSFMLNAYFYLGLKKSAVVLENVDAANARRISSEAADYLKAIRDALHESIALSPVVRLRDQTSVPSVPPYIGLRGFSSDMKDSVDPDRRHAYVYDCTIGSFHLLKGEVLEPNDPEVTWMLNAFEDRFFLFTPLPSRVNLEQLATDWFNLGGFEKLQPYYVHYQDAYLQRDQISNFIRGFYNTLASISDPQTLTFQEELDFGGAQPHKTHEEAWFFHQIRGMLVLEMASDLHLARGIPRRWLERGKTVAVQKAPTYFGEVSYQIRSFVDEGRIEGTVDLPRRNSPSSIYLRFRHPNKAPIRRVTLNGAPSKNFDPEKEWIRLPAEKDQLHVAAYY